MRISRFYLLLLFITTSVCGQDLSGKWSGTVYQGTSGYTIDVVITEYGKVLNGTSKITNADGNFVEQGFTGVKTDTSVTINENRVIFCLEGLTCAMKNMTGHIRINRATLEMTIDGNWTTNTIYKNKHYEKAPQSDGKFSISRIMLRPLDGYYKKTNIETAKVTPLPVLREADIAYSRRIWQEIDVREKKNQYMASPKGRLIDALMDAVISGELTAYDATSTKDDPDGDSFAHALTPAEAQLKMADSTVVNSFDKNGEKIGSKMVAGEFNPDSILKFRIKEDVVFDKQRSVEEHRIIGIAPLIKKKVDGSVKLIAFDYQPAFWIYFPEARKILVNKPVANNLNDATGLSYDDVFIKRLFTAYIVKQSTDKDDNIKDHAVGIDRLYEAEKIKKTLMDWELGLWQY